MISAAKKQRLKILIVRLLIIALQQEMGNWGAIAPAACEWRDAINVPQIAAGAPHSFTARFREIGSLHY
jgi:hypothetical protein